MAIVTVERDGREVEESGSSAVVICYPSAEAVFRAAYAPLVRALSSFAGPEAAEDAVQEAFVRLYSEWGRLASYENQAAWVRRVAIHRLIDRHRRLQRRALALVRQAPRDTKVASHVASQVAERLDLATAVRQLPTRQRLAVALFYLADLPVREVAEAMSISEGAVDRHLHDGREALRRFLEV